MTHSQVLRRKIELMEPRLAAAAGKLWNHPELKEFFGEYLISVHCIIRATSPSMRIAAQCAQALAESDPVAAKLAEYYARHSREEEDHDDWTLDDIESLGIDRSQVLDRVPSPTVASLVGAQYYWAYHCHPIAYMGYAAVLEGPASAEFLEQTVQRTGLPRKAFETQFMHAALDPHHIQAFNDTLDSLPLTSRHTAIAGVSALHSAHMLTCFFEEIVESYELSKVTL